MMLVDCTNQRNHLKPFQGGENESSPPLKGFFNLDGSLNGVIVFLFSSVFFSFSVYLKFLLRDFLNFLSLYSFLDITNATDNLGGKCINVNQLMVEP